MIDITSPRASSRPRTPEELLRLTDRTLGQTIEVVTGIEPALDVQRQWHLSPPHAPWVAPPLSGNGWVLGRGTAYRVDGRDLSRNVAYVDLTRIDGSTANDLEDGRINLGEMFRDPKIVKHDFRFGTDEDPEAADFDLVLRSCFPDVPDPHPYIWRRYLASNDRGIAFLVIESLPLAPWEVFLPQRAEATRRPRLSAGDDGANAIDLGAERYNATVDILERNLREGRGSTPYLRTDERDWSYEEVATAADAAGSGFLDMGLHPGDRVIVALRDRPEFVISFWGAMKAGLVPVPIAQGLPASDVHFILTDSEARLVLFDDSSSGGVVPALGDGDIVGIAVDPSDHGVAWNDVCGGRSDLSPAPTTADDITLWLYTSGATGQPKGVMHRHRSIRAAASNGLAAQVVGLGPDDVVLSVSKMFFAYGLGNSVYQPAAVGASVLINEGPSIPPRIQTLMDERRPTVLYGVPAFFAAYAHLPEADLPSSVRIVLSAGESLRPELFASFEQRFGLQILDGLGATEALHHVTCNRPEDAEPGSAGRAMEGYEVSAMDPQGEPVAEGETGELWLRGPTTFAGYWRRPDLTQHTQREGWIRTGDTVRIVDGRVHHEGRTDDLIKLAGMWVAPMEIEDVLRTHPDVLDAAVVAIDGPDDVPTLKAFLISSRDDGSLGRELASHCKFRLATYKVPRAFEVVEDLPRTPTGKLRRFVLRGN
jgi:benzoate-CoA ligase family protein